MLCLCSLILCELLQSDLVGESLCGKAGFRVIIVSLVYYYSLANTIVNFALIIDAFEIQGV